MMQFDFILSNHNRRYIYLLLSILLLQLPYQTISFHTPLTTKIQKHLTNTILNSNSNNELPTSTLNISIEEATNVLKTYDTNLNTFIQTDGNQGMGGGKSATKYWKTELSPNDYETLRQALVSLSTIALKERSVNSDEGFGRIMLGICANCIEDGIGALKGYVPNLNIPRGLLHGMDVDGTPIKLEGSIYIKYSTGGVMTFSQMRKTGLGLDALWKPGDAIVEMYDGDFEGVYVQCELSDGVFRQFGVLPLDLFSEYKV